MGGDDVCVVDVGVRGRRCVLGGRVGVTEERR